MWSIFNLPRFEVVVWVELTPSAPRIQALLYGAAEEDPYQAFEANDAKEHHWGFDSSEDALELIEKCKNFADDPAVVVSRFTSRDGSLKSFTIKDTRRVTH